MSTSGARPRRLAVGALWRDVLRLWRIEARDLYLAALVVEGIVVVLQLAVGHELDAVIDDQGRVDIAIDSLLALAWGMAGHHVLLGVGEGIVAADREGHPRPSMREVLLHQPWRALLASDLVQLLVTAALALVLLLPGLLARIAFSLVAPLIAMERIGVRAAFVRSARLVRPSVGRVTGVLAVGWVAQLALAQVLAQLVGLVSHAGWTHVLAHGVAMVVLAPITVLPTVLMAFELVAGERAARDGVATAEP